MLVMLGDLGVTSSLMFFRRRAQSSNQPFEVYTRASLRLNRFLFAACSPLYLLGYGWLALSRGYSLPATAAALLTGLGLAWFQFRALRAILLARLEENYRQAYLADGASAFVRMLGALAIFYFLPAKAAVAVAFSLAGSWLTVAILHARAADSSRGPTDSHASREVIAQILPSAPAAVYSAFQESIVLWLCALFAGVSNIAEVGALGRLGLLITVVSGLVPTLILPRLAAVHDQRRFFRNALAFALVLVVFGAALLGVAVVAPRAFLFLLGENYQHLQRELVILVATAAIGSLSGYVVGINQVRGWMRLQWVSVAVFVAAQAALLATFPISTTRGALIFGLASTSIGLSLQLVTISVGVLRPRWVTPRISVAR